MVTVMQRIGCAWRRRFSQMKAGAPAAMARRAAALAPLWAGVVFVAACASEVAPTMGAVNRPPPSSTNVLLVTPGDVMAERDVPLVARSNLEAAARFALDARGHDAVDYEPRRRSGATGRQVLLLHESVADTMLAVRGDALTLNIDGGAATLRTLGSGGQVLGRGYGTDYALIVSLRGRSGAARDDVAPAVVGPAGVARAEGERDLVASVVDLRSGDIIWFNALQVNPRRAFRDMARARETMGALLLEMPL